MQFLEHIRATARPAWRAIFTFQGELNGLASLCHPKENNHSQRVARIVQIEPFAKTASIHDFPDLERPLTRHEAAYDNHYVDHRDYAAVVEAY